MKSHYSLYLFQVFQKKINHRVPGYHKSGHGTKEKIVPANKGMTENSSFIEMLSGNSTFRASMVT